MDLLHTSGWFPHLLVCCGTSEPEGVSIPRDFPCPAHWRIINFSFVHSKVVPSVLVLGLFHAAIPKRHGCCQSYIHIVRPSVALTSRNPTLTNLQACTEKICPPNKCSPFVPRPKRNMAPTFLVARQAHLRRSWPFHGGELLRLVGMLVEWKTAGAVGGEPREVMLSLFRLLLSSKIDD